MSDQHTPEPWKQDEDSELLITNSELERVGETIVRTDTKADARRIVACINACKGIPTDQLEGRTFGKRYMDALKQRDELLAALWRSRNLIGCGSVEAAHNCICDAIDTAEEGAAWKQSKNGRLR